jgi:2-polyprenyl-3-methyl-5-hydroxy-6-metoxy-1,4-benzoquinol methylase
MRPSGKDTDARSVSVKGLERTLRSIALKYPADLVQSQLSDVTRIAFNIDLVLSRQGQDVTICDLAGGIGLFSVGCAALGMKSILVDDFGDAINLRVGDAVLDLHRSYGVQVIKRNIVTQGIDFAPDTIHAVTCFDAMEHFPRSPKTLFASVMRALSPGGLFVLAVPNCVNLRKRITVPLGMGKWSSMQDWYESERFRGHVREPDVEDLHYIARDIGLRDTTILGRNWLGYRNTRRAQRLLTRTSDRLLQLYPPVCSNIYLVGRKQPVHGG